MVSSSIHPLCWRVDGLISRADLFIRQCINGETFRFEMLLNLSAPAQGDVYFQSQSILWRCCCEKIWIFALSWFSCVVFLCHGISSRSENQRLLDAFFHICRQPVQSMMPIPKKADAYLQLGATGDTMTPPASILMPTTTFRHPGHVQR